MQHLYSFYVLIDFKKFYVSLKLSSQRSASHTIFIFLALPTVRLSSTENSLAALKVPWPVKATVVSPPTMISAECYLK